MLGQESLDLFISGWKDISRIVLAVTLQMNFLRKITKVIERLYSRSIMGWNQLRDMADRDSRASSVWITDLDK